MSIESNMTTKKECYFINPEKSADVDSIKKAFQWLFQQGGGYVAVNKNAVLDGIISQVIGEQEVKSLIKNGKVKVNGKEVILITERKSPFVGKGLPLVAIFPSVKFLDALQSIANEPAMLIVPLTMDSIKTWIKATNAKDLNAPINTAPEKLIENNVVVQALKQLSAGVNKSTGIIDFRDRDTVIEVFTILRDAGEDFKPEDVKAFLIREEGLKATYAQDIAELAEKVLEGKKLPRLYHPALASSWLDTWRKDAAEGNK